MPACGAGSVCAVHRGCTLRFAAATLVDKAVELDHIGGTYAGNRKPTPFMCLALKMLQIQPDKEIVIEFIQNEDYKCVPRRVRHRRKACGA